MQNKTKNNKERFRVYRKKMAACLLVGMLAVSTAVTGCGKKDIDYDVEENGGFGSNADSGSLQGKYGIPESCDTEIATGDSGIQKIAIDAEEVIVPDTGDLYVASFKKKETTNDSKKETVEAVLDKDKGIYEYDYDKRTKEDIQTEIDMYEAEKKKGDSDMASYYDSWINDLKDELATAPDEYPAAGDYTGDTFIGSIGDTRFTVSTPSEKNGTTGYSLYLADDFLKYRPKDGASGCYSTSMDDYMQYSADESDSVDANTNQCTFSEDEARQMADDFLAKVGCTDVTLKNTSALCWVYYDDNGDNQSTDVDGYTFTYSRAINNQPTATVNAWNVDNIQQDNASIDIPKEECSISIDSKGINSASWSEYLEADGEPQATQILSYKDLLDKMNETVPEYYSKYTSHYKKIEFNGMELTYFLKAGDKEGTFEYIPAWILSQYEEYQDYTDKDSPTQMVVVDARDGSVIDLLELAKSLGTYYTYDDKDDSDTEDVDDTDTDTDTSSEDTSAEDTSAEDTSSEE